MDRVRCARGPVGSPAAARKEIFTAFYCMLGCCALAILLSAQPAAAASDATVLVLGDSISAGYGIQRDQSWVNLLRARVVEQKPDATVVNASISGETSGGGLARLPLAIETHSPAVIVIELGGNDGLRGYPIRTIKQNLTHLVQASLTSGAQVVLVGMQIPPNYGPRYTQQFRDMFPTIAETEGAILVPRLMEKVALVPELMQADGIHPTADGQPLLLDAVWPYVEPLLEGLSSNP